MNNDELTYYAREVNFKMKRAGMHHIKVTIYVDRRTLIEFRRWNFNDAHAGLDQVRVCNNVNVSWAADLSPGDAPVIAFEAGDFWDFMPDNRFKPI